jgi:hypothetical protein
VQRGRRTKFAAAAALSQLSGVVFRCTRNWTRSAPPTQPRSVVHKSLWILVRARCHAADGARGCARSCGALSQSYSAARAKGGAIGRECWHIVRLTLLGAWAFWCMLSAAAAVCVWWRKENSSCEMGRGRERDEWKADHVAESRERKVHTPRWKEKGVLPLERCSRFQTQGCHVCIKSCIQCKTAQWKFLRNEYDFKPKLTIYRLVAQILGFGRNQFC